MIYLDGNSLGKLPAETLRRTEEMVRDQWGKRLIRSWNERWISLPQRIAARIANIIGASEEEVFVGDTTSLNLFKLAHATLQLQEGRHKIVTDAINFPTDHYVLQGLAQQQFPNHDLHVTGRGDEISPDISDLEQQLDMDTALLSLSLVAYKSAYYYDMAAINTLAHARGALVIWDLSHAAGAVPVRLNEEGADMAVGCTYKYLNGGPGAPAFLYVRKDLQEKLQNPVWAWFSHEKPFAFDINFRANKGIQRFATSTPTILSLAAIEPGLDLILEAGMENLREKSVCQSRLLLDMIKEFLLPLGFSLASPEEDARRGSHVSVRHPEGYRINRAMIEPGDGSVAIVPDFRPPDNIRLGIAPLYNSYTDIFHAVERMCTIVREKHYEAYPTKKLTVT
jgi:kynureninase